MNEGLTNKSHEIQNLSGNNQQLNPLYLQLRELECKSLNTLPEIEKIVAENPKRRIDLNNPTSIFSAIFSWHTNPEELSRKVVEQLAGYGVLYQSEGAQWKISPHYLRAVIDANPSEQNSLFHPSLENKSFDERVAYSSTQLQQGWTSEGVIKQWEDKLLNAISNYHKSETGLESRVYRQVEKMEKHNKEVVNGAIDRLKQFANLSPEEIESELNRSDIQNLVYMLKAIQDAVESGYEPPKVLISAIESRIRELNQNEQVA